ncbi:class I SAM-dependent rRNA methyltransferase [Butyrivibrio sp. MC2013]|uniref:class I SAM-dependent rRNA methyltransferase n=1 Tax=Butyrivibrio sp. MC2013 TaxID=1280686 RepID=UPI0004297959|nr:class I SAM-dependent rRNA methyltransferase [Butyrivibrio sp. MC2013]
MFINSSDAKVVLKKKEGRTIKGGGLWVFDNEIDHTEGSYEQGDIVEVHDFDGYFLGYGFINDASKIRARLMSRTMEHPVTKELIRQRLENAWNYRKSVYGFEADGLFHYQGTISDSCRLVFGESDYLPGITIDKFGDVLVIESLALGTDRMKAMILDELKDILLADGIRVRGIYERSDAKVREQEGLERVKGFIGEAFDTKVPIIENGLKYYVDVENGQKTGFFLDQKLNRMAIRSMSKGARVLDCFTHTGSFGMNAAAAGAGSVLSVDASQTGLDQAAENAAMNGLTDIISYKCGDAFDILRQMEADGELYDLVILDPPAFTKSRASVKKAAGGYRDINIRGMHLVKNGGFLATCTCSHFMDEEQFFKIVKDAARSAHKTLRQVSFSQQAPDHPIMVTNEASYYLKFYIFQVLDEM